MTDSGMDDLISRTAAVRALASSNGDYLDALERFEKIPTVDAVPVVRCKDCMYWKSDMLTHFWKPCDVVSTDKDWYCPCSKRR